MMSIANVGILKTQNKKRTNIFHTESKKNVNEAFGRIFLAFFNKICEICNL